MTSLPPAIECEEVRRVYTARSFLGGVQETLALDGITLAIPQGIVFGLLGPNGAGKTTLVRILSTLLTPTAGRARVLGFDVEREARQVRQRIGLVLGGERGLYWRLTGRENLLYFGALNGMDGRQARARSDELLALVGLHDRGNSPVEQYSRGMRQRLHIARGLLTDPSVIFMDEPTLGLDPFAARELREIVPELAHQGKTVLLTTHYMFEADALCERIALIHRGQLVAVGTPADIKRQFSGIQVIDVTLKEPRHGLAEEIGSIPGVKRVDVGLDGTLQKLTIQITAGDQLRDRVAAVVGESNVETLLVRDPTLEEAYLTILE